MKAQEKMRFLQVLEVVAHARGEEKEALARQVLTNTCRCVRALLCCGA